MRNCFCVGVNDLSRSRSAVQAHSAECWVRGRGVLGGVEVRGNLGITLHPAHGNQQKDTFTAAQILRRPFFWFLPPQIQTAAQLWCQSYLRLPPPTSQQPPSKLLLMDFLFVRRASSLTIQLTAIICYSPPPPLIPGMGAVKCEYSFGG